MHYVCNHTPLERHLGVSRWKPLKIKPLWTFVYKFFFKWTKGFISLGEMSKSTFARSYGSCMLSFITFKLFSKVLIPFQYSYHQRMSDPVFPHPSRICCYYYFYFNHSDRYVVFFCFVLFSVGFFFFVVVLIGISLMANEVEHIFMCLSSVYSVYYLQWNVWSLLLHIF